MQTDDHPTDYAPVSLRLWGMVALNAALILFIAFLLLGPDHV